MNDEPEVVDSTAEEAQEPMMGSATAPMIPPAEVLDRLLHTNNIASGLTQEQLDDIGEQVVEWFRFDLDSRNEWKERNEKWIKLASQLIETKNTPWPNAANVKYPLLTTAAMQFHARVLPAIINNNTPVRVRVVGKDTDGNKRNRAERVSAYMSYQLLVDMEEWVDDFDRLLYGLALVGTAFKKTYYSQSLGRNVSEYVPAQDLVVNYYAANFEQARKTHYFPLSRNEMRSAILSGLYVDQKMSDPTEFRKQLSEDDTQGLSPNAPDDDIPYTVLECHCWLDLDDDGYEEPYIVTTEMGSRKVLRIVARWESDGVQAQGEQIIRITPLEYFTSYILMPDPNSRIYGMGLGSLVGPTNEAINTLLNQLIDAGTLSNLQGGFLGKGIRIRGGATRFLPGEWKQTQTTGDDLRKGIFPLPVREPSTVLFQLLGLLIQSGEKLSSVSDLMTGQNPGQNQPFSTTMTVLEQGMKLFSSIFRRIHRSLGKEFQKLYNLNRIFMDESVYFNVLDENVEMQVLRQDFEPNSKDIVPASDPDIVSEAQKLVKSESLLQKIAAGLPLNVQEVTRRVLEAEGHTGISDLMNVPPPQPPMDMQFEMQKFEHQKQMDMINVQLESIKVQYQAMRDEAAAMAQGAKTQQGVDEQARKNFETKMAAANKQQELFLHQLEIILNSQQSKSKETKNDQKKD